MGYFVRGIAFVLTALVSKDALAEVSEKFATIPEIFLQGLIASIVGFFLARWRIWLVAVGIAAGALLFSRISLLWYDVHMGEALIAEQGYVYFVAIGFSGLAVIASSILGALLWLREYSAAES
jgi:hypothetical protein